MKLPITIEYNSGESVTYVAGLPEWVKWEKTTGKVISSPDANIGLSDLIFLAYHAMKREAAGKPVKPIDIWTETVANIEVEKSDPKATQSEA